MIASIIIPNTITRCSNRISTTKFTIGWGIIYYRRIINRHTRTKSILRNAMRNMTISSTIIPNITRWVHWRNIYYNNIITIISRV